MNITDLAEMMQPGGHDGVYARPTAYDVTVWPPGVECMDSETWKTTVEYRGAGKWAITRGGMRTCLSVSGKWDWEMQPSEREEEWLADHRFTLTEAMRVAKVAAPKVMVNGMTAAEVLARHQERHPDGKCNG